LSLYFSYLCTPFIEKVFEMMKAKKVLFITQEITPYVPESQMSTIGRELPQAIQDTGREIRTFMPKWGNINERRNQLHEVIRLSGMNMIIDDTDHPLIIKVASIQTARMQVYFIDNEDSFQDVLGGPESENNDPAEDDSRAIFYARGVIETVKKLRWVPDVIHCQGWMTALAPLFIKKAFHDEPSFANAKIVTSIYDKEPKEPFNSDFQRNLVMRGFNEKAVKALHLDEHVDYTSLMKLAIDYSDGVVQNSETVHAGIMDYARSKNVPVIDYIGDKDQYVEACSNLYDQLMGE